MDPFLDCPFCKDLLSFFCTGLPPHPFPRTQFLRKHHLPAIQPKPTWNSTTDTSLPGPPNPFPCFSPPPCFLLDTGAPSPRTCRSILLCLEDTPCPFGPFFLPSVLHPQPHQRTASLSPPPGDQLFEGLPRLFLGTFL